MVQTGIEHTVPLICDHVYCSGAIFGPCKLVKLVAITIFLGSAQNVNICLVFLSQKLRNIFREE